MRLKANSLRRPSIDSSQRGVRNMWTVETAVKFIWKAFWVMWQSEMEEGIPATTEKKNFEPQIDKLFSFTLHTFCCGGWNLEHKKGWSGGMCDMKERRQQLFNSHKVCGHLCKIASWNFNVELMWPRLSNYELMWGWGGGG